MTLTPRCRRNRLVNPNIDDVSGFIVKGGAQQNSEKTVDRAPMFETETKFFEPSSDLQDVINQVAAESFKNRFNEDAVKSSLTIPHRQLTLLHLTMLI